MSDRMYLYEIEPDSHWLGAEECAPQNAAVAVAVAHWAGLDTPGTVRWTALPGGARIYWLSSSRIVSTVPLPWLPERTRRGVVTLDGAK